MYVWYLAQFSWGFQFSLYTCISANVPEQQDTKMTQYHHRKCFKHQVLFQEYLNYT